MLYTFGAVFCVGAVAFFGYRSAKCWRASSVRGAGRWRLLIVAGGVLYTLLCAVFVSLFIHLVVLEPVLSVVVGPDALVLERRWSRQTIPWQDIVQVRLTENEKGLFGNEVRRPLRHKIILLVGRGVEWRIDSGDRRQNDTVVKAFEEIGSRVEAATPQGPASRPTHE